MGRIAEIAALASAMTPTVTAVSAQNVIVHPFDRPERPTYARAWLANEAEGSTRGQGRQAVNGGCDDAESAALLNAG